MIFEKGKTPKEVLEEKKLQRQKEAEDRKKDREEERKRKKEEKDNSKYENKISKKGLEGKIFKRGGYGSTLGLSNPVKKYSLYCMVDESTGYSKIFVENMDNGREVYCVICLTTSKELQIEEAYRLYSKKHTANCITVKGKVSPPSLEKKKSIQVEDDNLSLSSEYRDSKINSFVSNIEKYCSLYIKVYKVIVHSVNGNEVTVVLESPKLLDGTHCIVHDILEKNYKYYHNGKLSQRTFNLIKLFK